MSSQTKPVPKRRKSFADFTKMESVNLQKIVGSNIQISEKIQTIWSKKNTMRKNARKIASLSNLMASETFLNQKPAQGETSGFTI